jgi:RHS repeat-associated protein
VALPANVTGGTSTVYNADNAQTKFNGTALSYDANGNLTSDGTNTYTWDARNHLIAISGGSTASFLYDGFGRRVKKVIGGTTTQLLYDGLNPVQELNGRHNPAVIANLLTGLRVDEYFTRTDTSTGVTSTLLADALGSTIGLVSSGGTIATSYTYQPFGATAAGGVGNTNPYQFTGRENDGTGLYFYRARYYSPTFQRFVTQDPIDFAGRDANLYAYVWGNPLSNIDPFGLSTLTYDNSTHTLTLTTNDGNTQSFPAYNNAQRTSRGPWPEGTYNYDQHIAHPDDEPDSAYGSNGGYLFHVPGRSGMEVHSGRESIPDRRGRSGPQHATNGCIRTNDSGTDAIQNAIDDGDPVTSITVIR